MNIFDSFNNTKRVIEKPLNSELEIAKYLKRRLNKSIKEFGNQLIGDNYHISSYPINQSKNFDLLKEECRKLNFYIDYIENYPFFRKSNKSNKTTILVYLSRTSH